MFVARNIGPTLVQRWPQPQHIDELVRQLWSYVAFALPHPLLRFIPSLQKGISPGGHCWD